MKKFAFGFAAAVALGLVSLAAPASAAAPVTTTGIEAPMTDVSAQRVVRRTTVVRGGPAMRRGRVCSVRTVRSRGPMGRVVVRKTRVCR